MYKKICLTTITLCAFFLAAPLACFATVTTASVTVGTQGLFTKDIPVDLAVSVLQPVSQVRIQWIVPYGVHTALGVKTAYNTTLVPGNTLYDHIVIVPDFEGAYPITATISGLQDGQPFTESVTTTIHVDSALQLQENANIHTFKVVAYVLLCIGCLGVFVFLIRAVYNEMRSRFHTWLNKES